MNSVSEWSKALAASPNDKTLLLAYADWLEEQGEQFQACEVRQRAGAGTLVYRLWHPSWGDQIYGEWIKLHHLKSHVRGKERRWRGKYHLEHSASEVDPKDLVVVIEWRARSTEVGRRPFSFDLEVT
jgi:uncharacterized protein (TIGR02996 family)